MSGARSRRGHVSFADIQSRVTTNTHQHDATSVDAFDNITYDIRLYGFTPRDIHERLDIHDEHDIHCIDCPPSCSLANLMICITRPITRAWAGCHEVDGLTPVLSASTAVFTLAEPRSRHS
jgi:hypothetical protein